ncbi:MAG: DUF4153 domain-containing protein [Roseburia sp.]|nr:DUF4153 domain-containing protein [Roseburia sp.]MCM1242646.1 DUF4153 domain-containing protein [Roseburia sp.]
MIKSLQTSLQDFLQKIKYSFADCKVTFITVILLTLYAAVIDILPYDYFSEWIFDESAPARVLLFFAIAAFFIETAWREKKRGIKLCAFTATALWAVFLAYGLEVQGHYYWGWKVPEYFFFFIRPLLRCLLNCGLPLLLLGTVYYSYKKAKLRFGEYVLRVFTGLLKIFLVYMILFVGIVIITSIMDALLFDDGNWYFDSTLMILVTGFYLAPKSIMAIRRPDGEPGEFVRTIIKYILPSLSVCEIALVYLYAFKILIHWQMPSNEVFPIVTAVFCLGMPVWIMAEHYADETKYSRLVSVLPYIFAPLILLQIYAMGVRIFHNGMTPSRYLALVFVIFELAALFIRRFKQKRYELLLPFTGVLLIIAIVVPGINMYKVSNMWQGAFLRKYYAELSSGGQLTELSYTRLKGAYDYLKKDGQMQTLIQNYNIYEEEFAQKLNEQDIIDGTMTDYDNHTIHCCQLVESVDVGDYEQFTMLNEDDSYEKDAEGSFVTVYPDENGEDKEIAYGSGIDVDFSAFRFIKRGSQEMITVDISDFARMCILYEREHSDADKEEMSEAMRPYNRIELDKDTVLYINHFEVRYSEGVKYGEPYFEWTRVNLGGILVTR